MAVTTKAQRKSWLNLVRLKTGGAPRLQVGLMTNGTWDEDNDLSDILEANYSGYVRMDPAFTAETINSAGEASAISVPLLFLRAVGPVDSLVTGWFLVGTDDQGVNRLYGGDLFPDGPFPFNVAGYQQVWIFFLADKQY